MFTGIITDLGRVRQIDRNGGAHITFETAYDTETIPIGASIACNGACMTVTAVAPACFSVQASNESLSKTTMGHWYVGMPVNLERPLKLGDELGGHMVLGHVDGVARVVSRHPDGDSLRLVLTVSDPLARYIAVKGSVSLDGVSMTVNHVDGLQFDVNVIPHTQKATNLGGLQEGDEVNLEVDMLARYAARLMERNES